MRVPLSWPNNLPKVWRLQMPPHWALGYNMWIWGGGRKHPIFIINKPLSSLNYTAVLGQLYNIHYSYLTLTYSIVTCLENDTAFVYESITFKIFFKWDCYSLMTYQLRATMILICPKFCGSIVWQILILRLSSHPAIINSYCNK